MSDGRGRLRAGTLYAALERLEGAGAVALETRSARAVLRGATTGSRPPASTCSRTRAAVWPTTRSSSATGFGARGRGQHDRAGCCAARRPGVLAPRAGAARRSSPRRARVGRRARARAGGELASLLALALRPRLGPRTVWLQGAVAGRRRRDPRWPRDAGRARPALRPARPRRSRRPARGGGHACSGSGGSPPPTSVTCSPRSATPRSRSRSCAGWLMLARPRRLPRT